MMSNKLYSYVNRWYRIEENSRKRIIEYTLKKIPEEFWLALYLDNPLEDNFRIYINSHENLERWLPTLKYSQGEVEMISFTDLNDDDLLDELLYKTWKESALCLWYDSQTDMILYFQFKHPSIMILWDDDPELSDEEILDQERFGNQIISFVEDGSWWHKVMHIWTCYLEYYQKLRQEFPKLFKSVKLANLSYHEFDYDLDQIISFLNIWKFNNINLELNNWSYFPDENTIKTTLVDSHGVLIQGKTLKSCHISFECLTVAHKLNIWSVSVDSSFIVIEISKYLCGSGISKAKGSIESISDDLMQKVHNYMRSCKSEWAMILDRTQIEKVAGIELKYFKSKDLFQSISELELKINPKNIDSLISWISNVNNIPVNWLVTLRISGFAFQLISESKKVAERLWEMKIKNLIVDDLYTEGIDNDNNFFYFFKDSEYLDEINIVEHRSKKSEEINLKFLKPSVSIITTTHYTDLSETWIDEDWYSDEEMDE